MHLNWYDIEPHTIHIRGLDSSEVTLVADMILAMDATRSSPAAIGFTATIAIRHQQPLDFQFVGGFYGCLSAFQSQLLAVRNGELEEAAFNMEGLSLNIHHHKIGVRSDIIVAGECSSNRNADADPWSKTKHGVGDWIIKQDGDSIYNVRFAFRTAQVDPPLLDNAISDIAQLNSYIKSLGGNNRNANA